MKAWTESEKIKLLKMLKSGASWEEISTSLGKTVAACKNKRGLLLGRTKKNKNDSYKNVKTDLEKEIIAFAKRKDITTTKQVTEHFKINTYRVLSALKGTKINLVNTLEYQANMSWTASGRWNAANKTGLN